ncbi:MAG: hypothetical protein KIC61_00235 [Staphylococcus sp.]|jgi:hypothetical protein|nr:hypothetical protein [Staphylococcus sp.]
MILRKIIAYTILPLIMLFIGVLGIVYPEKVNKSVLQFLEDAVLIVIIVLFIHIFIAILTTIFTGLISKKR